MWRSIRVRVPPLLRSKVSLVSTTSSYGIVPVHAGDPEQAWPGTNRACIFQNMEWNSDKDQLEFQLVTEYRSEQGDDT